MPAPEPSHRAAAAEIVRALRAAGHVAYFAGGCVRDELLGLTPQDYDVATDAPPVRIASIFKRTSEVGASFGVVLVKSHGVAVEVATFRSEGPYTDRRRPDTVRFSDAPTDARRRDFTVNALFLDPLDNHTAPQSPAGGHVIDHVGGTGDLDRRVLRAVGDPEQRLAEDHLRALRAVRLTARLDLAIDPATAAAIARHARELAGVSRERIGEELRRMLSHASRSRAVSLLCQLGLDGPVLEEPSLPWRAGILQEIGTANASFPGALAAWALDRGASPDATDGGAVSRRWRNALALSNDETVSLKSLVAGVGTLEGQWGAMSAAARKRTAVTDWFEESLQLVAARRTALARDIRSDVERLRQTPSGLAPAPLLTGDDLIAAGFRPGPAFKSVLERVYDCQLEDRVRTREEALNLARECLKGHGGDGGHAGAGSGEPPPRPGV